MKKILLTITILSSVILWWCLNQKETTEEKVKWNQNIMTNSINFWNISIQFPSNYTIIPNENNYSEWKFNFEFNYSTWIDSSIQLNNILIENKELLIKNWENYQKDVLDKYCYNKTTKTYDTSMGCDPQNIEKNINIFEEQKQEFWNNNEYSKVINNREYIIRSNECEGDICYIRQYITYIDNYRVSSNITFRLDEAKSETLSHKEERIDEFFRKNIFIK